MTARIAKIAVGSTAAALCVGVSAHNCFTGPQPVKKDKTAQASQGSTASSATPQHYDDAAKQTAADFDKKVGIMELAVATSGLVCLYGGVLHQKRSKRAELRRGRTCMRASVITQDGEGRDRFMEAGKSAAGGSTGSVLTQDPQGRDRFMVAGASMTPALVVANGSILPAKKPVGLWNVKTAALTRSPEVSELDFYLSSQPGVCEPYGIPGVSIWDPLGLSSSKEKFRIFRQAEIKHGRVSMLANVGLVAQHEWRFNFDYPYTGGLSPDIPSGFQAINAPEASSYFGALVIIAGIHEFCFKDDDKEPGNFGDPGNFGNAWFAGGLPDAQLANFRTTEINNGRLAMFGVIGSLLAENATGLDAVNQWKYAGVAWQRTVELTWFPEHAVGPLLTIGM